MAGGADATSGQTENAAPAAGDEPADPWAGWTGTQPVAPETMTQDAAQPAAPNVGNGDGAPDPARPEPDCSGPRWME